MEYKLKEINCKLKVHIYHHHNDLHFFEMNNYQSLIKVYYLNKPHLVIIHLN